MLAQETIRRVERLVASNRYSLADIARMTYASRSAVQLIAKGEYCPKYGPKRTKRAEESQIPYPPVGAHGRANHCKKCGGDYYGRGCYTCFVREYATRV